MYKLYEWDFLDVIVTIPSEETIPDYYKFNEYDLTGYYTVLDDEEALVLRIHCPTLKVYKIT